MQYFNYYTANGKNFLPHMLLIPFVAETEAPGAKGFETNLKNQEDK